MPHPTHVTGKCRGGHSEAVARVTGGLVGMAGQEAQRIDNSGAGPKFMRLHQVAHRTANTGAARDFCIQSADGAYSAVRAMQAEMPIAVRDQWCRARIMRSRRGGGVCMQSRSPQGPFLSCSSVSIVIPSQARSPLMVHPLRSKVTSWLSTRSFVRPRSRPTP
jgi:hypothetical protein